MRRKIKMPDGTTLHYLERPAPASTSSPQTLLVIPGFTMAADNFASPVHALLESWEQEHPSVAFPFRVLVIDLLYTGANAKPGTPDDELHRVNMQAMIAAVNELADALGLCASNSPPLHLYGYSLGAGIAVRVVASKTRLASRVRSVVAVAPAFFEILDEHYRTECLSGRVGHAFETSEDARAFFLACGVHDAVRPSTKVVMTALAYQNAVLGAGYFSNLGWGLMGAPGSEKGLTLEEFADSLASCSVPCLLLIGETDRIVSIEKMSLLQAAFGANAELLTLPGCGHFGAAPPLPLCKRVPPMWTNSILTVGAPPIMSFLARHL